MRNSMVAILVLAVFSVSADWNPPESGCTVNDLRGIHFFNPDRGWAVGDGGTICATTDGGRNWTIQQDGIYLYDLNDVHFTSESVGWAVGTSGHALHTINGGSSWFDTTVTVSDINALHFVDTEFGVTVGDGGLFLYTTDGGQNWIERKISPADLYDVHFLNRTVGWCTSRGDIGHTTDGGRNWDFVHPTSQMVYGISFPDSVYGWACGDSGIVCQTTDGGHIWNCTSIAPGALWAIHFVHPVRGWTVGVDGTILHTVDGGNTWDQDVSGVFDDLYDIYFLDWHHAWVCGQAGTILIGTGTGIEELPIPRHGCEFRHYPSSTRGQSHFVLPVGNLEIYDCSGRLLWEFVSHGPARVTWNGRDSLGRPLPSGIYFFVFRNSEGVTVGKTLLIK